MLFMLQFRALQILRVPLRHQSHLHFTFAHFHLELGLALRRFLLHPCHVHRHLLARKLLDAGVSLTAAQAMDGELDLALMLRTDM